jgi:hypothetical protein
MPGDMKRHVLSFLTVHELVGTAGLVSWQWHVYSQDELLWLLHYYYTWKFKPEYELIYRTLGFKWRHIFILRFKTEKRHYMHVEVHPNSNGVHECRVQRSFYGLLTKHYADFFFAGVPSIWPDSFGLE